MKKHQPSQGYGLIQVLTGNGKGKTTSALGDVMRTIGAGKRAAIIFFDKGGAHYSERSVLTQLGVEWVATGRDRIEPSGRFDFSIVEKDKEEAARGLSEAWRLFEEEEIDLLVLDEINSTTDLGMLTAGEVLELLDKKPPHVEVILTGRNAPEAFLERAHLVTDVTLVKHYFYSGTKAREGIDF